MTETTSVPKVTVRREIAASAEELFDAWLNSASLAVWMRAGGLTDSTAKTGAIANLTCGSLVD